MPTSKLPPPLPSARPPLARLAGVTIPLFSIRSRADWGIGQIGDLPLCARWLRRAGHRLLQILPPHELSEGETSPYGARTAFGLDPIYVTLEDVPELQGGAMVDVLGGLAGAAEEREALRGEAQVQYSRVRALKAPVLHEAFVRFRDREWAKGTERARALARFIEAERPWAQDLALYGALRDEHGGAGWSTWPTGEKSRDPRALADTETRLAGAILEHHYGQWLAFAQWDRARAQLKALGVELMGDLPFIVGQESADLWAHPRSFRTDVSLGAPPDFFAPEGQDWGLPAYDWIQMKSDGFAWLRLRAKHAARLYDRFRLDHVLGFYRMYLTTPRGASAGGEGLEAAGSNGREGHFEPQGDDVQRAHGEEVLRAIVDAARPAQVIAEDLGMVPPFVRASLIDLRIPGYKVLPWEKDQDVTFRPPADFSPLSVSCWSTHDTAPITAWWSDLPEHEQVQLSHLAKFANERASITPEERVFKLLRLLQESGSSLTLTQAQELLGDLRRVNKPGTVGPENWTYRLPRPIEDLEADRALGERFGALQRVVEETGR